jgi:hypothetical protein
LRQKKAKNINPIYTKRNVNLIPSEYPEPYPPPFTATKLKKEVIRTKLLYEQKNYSIGIPDKKYWNYA